MLLIKYLVINLLILTLLTSQEYIMEGLSGKTVLLVTHQVDFLPAFDFVLVI